MWFGTKPGFYRYTVRYYGISVRRPLTLKHQLPLTLLPDCRPNYPTILSFTALKHNIYIENFGLEARKSRNQVRDHYFTILQLGAPGGGPGAP